MHVYVLLNVSLRTLRFMSAYFGQKYVDGLSDVILHVFLTSLRTQVCVLFMFVDKHFDFMSTCFVDKSAYSSLRSKSANLTNFYPHVMDDCFFLFVFCFIFSLVCLGGNKCLFRGG